MPSKMQQMLNLELPQSQIITASKGTCHCEQGTLEL